MKKTCTGQKCSVRLWKQNRETMRTFTEEELTQAIVDAFDEGVSRGASWCLAGDLPSLEVRRAIASNDCLDILNKAIRNQSEKQS